MTRLYLVRHARATSANDLRLPGPDLLLTEEGKRQADLLAHRLRSLAPDALYASDAARARQTAEAIGRHAPEGGLSVTVDQDLREMNFGAWAGRLYEDIIKEQPCAADYFAHPSAGAPPGGERLSDVSARVVGALDRISQRYPTGRVVVVGHAGSLRLALTAALGLPLDDYWRFRLDCAGLSVLGWGEGGVMVEGLNDVSHLANEVHVR